MTGAFIQALSFLPMIALPLLFPEHALPILIVCIVVYFGGTNLVVPQWSSLMGDLVPEQRRGRFFALRTRMASMTSFVALVLAGVVLHLSDAYHVTAYGYMMVFGVAAIARCVSAYHLAQLHDPPGHVAVLENPFKSGLWHNLRYSKSIRFSLFFALMQFSVAIASPFFTVYMLRDLGFSYLQFMTSSAASVLIQFLTLNTWGKVSDLYGNRLIMVGTGCVIPLLPSLWLVSADFAYILMLQLLGGAMWAGFSLSAGNFLYDLLPGHKRMTYFAFHNVLAAGGVFGGAMLGGYLGSVIPATIEIAGLQYTWVSPLCGIFLLSTVSRLLVCAIFLPHTAEVRVVRPWSVNVIFRIARFNPLSGITFDVLGSWRARRQRKPRLKRD